MDTHLRLGFALAVLGLAGTAWAVKPGGVLYIKTKDAKVFDKADPRARAVGTLQPGSEVVWQGSAPDNKLFHRVKAGSVQGFTLQQNLTPNRPQPEVLLRDDGKPIDKQAFASSGAATKALSEAAFKYAENKKTPEALLKGVLTAEGLAASVSREAGQAYIARQTGGAK